MILYFSGTGNSRYAAERLAARLNEEIVSIGALLKRGESGDFASQTPYVFVCPTYAWRIPRVMRAFIEKAHFAGCQEAYFVLTCGTDAGAADKDARRLCAEKSFVFRGLAAVQMPENYLAMFDTPTAEEGKRIVANAVRVLERAAKAIAARQELPALQPNLLDQLKSGPVNSLFYTFCVSDRRFWVKDTCVGCGKCAVLCPMNDIRMEGGKPVWNGRCTHCMACISACPARAIEYGKASAKRPRWYLETEEPHEGI